MKKIHIGVSYLILSAAFCLAEPFSQNETIQKEFIINKGDTNFELIVDNMWGSVSVKGVSDHTIKAVIHKKIKARSEKQLQWATEEVVLDISDETNLIEFFVDGPFREHDEQKNDRRWNQRKYSVHYNFELEVPQEISIDIRTVNDGDIRIENIHGDYIIKNINGGIIMKGLRGSGDAYALNKDLICYFDHNPTKECSFGSLNGDVKLYFQNPLSAEFAMKTFNGDAYSDFELTHVTSDPEIIKETKGRTIYKSVHRYCAKTGKGGPLIKWDGFNGDLLILKYRKGEQL